MIRVVSDQHFFFNRVVSHQGGLSTWWSLIMVVFDQGGLLIRVIFDHNVLSSEWYFIGVVSH